ncbi:hypothetical protein [uncultured Stenotrophomonas sp.]|uniref:hypothetical protein n=1 Tax=uncultured Stenotrophomonas sp. TaxID=165438 RepID=UPI0025EEC0FF|nr:hypothetical protein [uncultured Stenotrophomonas sp.]
MKRSVVGGAIAFSMLAAAGSSGAHSVESSDPMRKLVCEAMGGVDVTGEGVLTMGKDVTAAAVCQMPASQTTSRNAAAAPRAFPLSPVTAAVHPPSGNLVLPAGETQVTTSCAADLHIPAISAMPSVSAGLSTVKCRGYNTPTNSSAGCSIDWTGPTNVTLGAQPYGGRVVVNFSCVAFRSGIPTVMDYEYRDPTYPRLIYQARDVTGYLNIAR